ncbi:MAG: DsbA family protein [Alphaproteobacteria bacterium]|nr:DsbA family protein [Alphaproteobacteria bacterium]
MHNKYVSGFKVATASAALLALAACGDSGEKPADTDAAEAAAEAVETPAVDVAQQGEGTWGDLVYGDPDAPVTIIEYASLTCPHCATFARVHMPKIKKDYIDTGKAKLIYRNFIMNRVDIAASAAARCGNDETTKKLMEVYFARQSDWARSANPLDELASLARRAGISRTQFDRCVSNDAMLKHLMQMTMGAQKDYNINSTPSFVVNEELVEYRTIDELMEKIAEAVADGS